MASLRSATIQDVAKAAGVSTATVSYVLSGGGPQFERISAETAQRVREVARGLGYAPNESARSLRRRRSDRICLVLPRIGAPYYDALVNDMQKVADAHGYTTLVGIADTPERERHLIDQLRRRLVDGVLFVEPHTVNAADIAPIAATGIAVVIYSDSLSVPGCDQVKTVEDDAIANAVQLLCEQGRDDIVLLGDLRSMAQEARLDDYLQTLAAKGLDVDRSRCLHAADRMDAYRQVLVLLERRPRPSGIIAMADLLGIGALLAAQDAGLSVPGDLAVIGYGNIPEGEITRPPLTTIGPDPLDFTEVGELLFSRLAGEAPPKGRVHVQTRKLILRESL